MKKIFAKNISKKWLLALSVTAAAVLGVFGAVFAASSSTVDYSNMTIQEVWEAADESGEPLTYVFTGDSITHNSRFTQGMNSHSEWFEQYLYDIGRNKDVVINTAWGGSDTRHFLSDAEREAYDDSVNHMAVSAFGVNFQGMGVDDFITKHEPDVVFIKLGMNDRGRLKDTAEFKANYEKILDNVYKAGKTNGVIPKVVMISTTPRGNDNIYNTDQVGPGSCWSWRNAAEELAKEYSEENNVTIEFVDNMGAYMDEYENLGDDYWFTFFSQVETDGYIHPNAAGQYLIFKTVSKTLGIYDKDMPIYQYKYDDFNDANLWTDKTDGVTYTNSSWSTGTSSTWLGCFTKNGMVIYAGSDQISTYPGTAVNRSLHRLMDNAIRRISYNYYTIRTVNAGNGYTVKQLSSDASILNTHFDKAGYSDDSLDGKKTLILIPDVDTSVSVANFTTYVKNVLANSNADKKIVWTPLASGDSTRNAKIADYAEAVRSIVETSGYTDVLLFDAYAFMTSNMSSNSSLATNWFEDSTHLSPVGTTDVARAFFNVALPDKDITELTDHNLRNTSDARLYKEGNVRDYVSATATANNSAGTIAVDVSKIVSAYSSVKDIKIAWIPTYGAGDNNENIRFLDATKSGNVYTVSTPCKNPVLAIYGTVGSTSYRFKDLKVTATVVNAYKDATPTPSDTVLQSLEVVGAATFNNPEAGSYDVTLHQYQKDVQIRATAEDGLNITVNNVDVKSGELSQLISVDSEATITVVVSGTGLTSHTYTLNLERPDYADIIITEVMQQGGSNYDLIEIYNASGRDLDLKDYSIGCMREYPDARYLQDDSESWPYYFIGNKQTFSGQTRYTCINQITKNSSYWTGSNVVTEPTSINFPADSTMVIWVKYSGNGADYTYDTLISKLKSLETKIQKVDGTKIVPSKDQIVIAECPSGYANGLTDRSSVTLSEVTENYFYLDNFTVATSGSTGYTRNWLYVLDSTAKMGTNGAITEDGDDIISASNYVRVDGVDYSTKFIYNTDRGMSEAKAYLNKNSFGAIDRTQKPADVDDTTKPKFTDNTEKAVALGSDVTITFDVTDDMDVRYLELYVREKGASSYTQVTKDYVLANSMESSLGIAADETDVTYTYTLADVSDTVEYYAVAYDGNENMAVLGSKSAPKTVTVLDGDYYFTTLSDVQSTYRVKDAEGNYACPPAEDGYIFAGWYSDIATPLEDGFTQDTAMAKFVPAAILDVRAQVLGGTNFTKDKSNIRFITSVDSLNYQTVGFDFQVFDDVTNPTEANRVLTGKESNNVYLKLKGLGSGGTVLNYVPQTVFSAESEYFMAYTLTGVANKYFGTGIIAKPYWVTMDGTKVYGIEGMKTINMGYTPYLSEMNVSQMGADIVYVDSVTSAQGGCTDGIYYYQATLNSASQVVINQLQYSDTKETWSVVNSSSALSLGEASDMVYNPRTEMLVIAHGTGAATSVSIMDPETLIIDSTVTLASEISSIAYSTIRDQYVVGLADGTGMKVLDAAFVDTGVTISASGAALTHTVQSITADDNYIYTALSDGTTDTNVIAIYDWDGTYIATVSIDAEDMSTTVTPASISVYRNAFYVSANKDNGYAIYKVSGMSLSEDYVASIVRDGATEYYLTIESALVNAQANDTVYVLKNATMNSTASVGAENITLTNVEGADVTITRGTSDTIFDNRTTGFTVKSASTGSLSIDGAELEGETLIANTKGAALTLEKITVSNINSSVYGGVVDNYGDMTVKNCIFTDNAAAKRAPVFYLEKKSTTNITGSRFAANTATAGSGGVVFADEGSTATIIESVFDGNTSKNNGGAIQCAGATITATDCTFTDNTVTGENGGALAVSAGGVVVLDGTQGTFNGNEAILGGAIYTNASVVNVSGYTFEGNTATTAGGAAYVNSTVASDEIAPELTDIAFVDSTFISNIVGNGSTITSSNLAGAVYVKANREVLIDKCSFESHTSHQGGALWIGESSEVDIVDSTFKNNTSKASAGALYAVSAKLNLENTDFTSNTSGTAGGAINATGANNIGTTLMVTDCDFTSNIANSTSEGGGAVSITGTTVATFDGTGSFSKNSLGTTSSTGGGAIYTNNSTVTIEGNYTFENNEALGNGGAIFANRNGNPLYITGATFKGNTATSSGTALYAYRTLYLCNTDFTSTDNVVLGTYSTSAYGKAYISGKLTDATFVYTQDAANVLVGPGGIDRDSTVTLKLVSDAYTAGNDVLKIGDSTTLTDVDKVAQLRNTAEIVKVTQTATSPTASTYWYVDEDGNLAQGLDSSWVTVGTSSCDYTSLADAISKEADGTTICVMTDLTVDSTISISKAITLVTNPYNTDGVTITRGASLVNAMFNITSGGNLSLQGRLTIDGNGSNVTGTTQLIKNMGTFTLGTHATIQNVSASVTGGALYNDQGTLYIYGTFKNNTSTASGGAIRTQAVTSRIYVEGALFEGNTSGSEGGAISATASGAYMKLANTTFKNNTSTSNAGAVRANLITLDVFGCTFEGNEGGTGGGAMYASCPLTIDDYVVDDIKISTTLFSQNVANVTGSSSYGGGAIRFSNSDTVTCSMSVNGAEFKNNSVTGTDTTKTTHGGAIHVQSGDSFTLTNATFTGNTAELNGGAVYTGAGTNKITGCTFDSNVSGRIGGAVYVNAASSVTVEDTVFNNNQCVNSGAALMLMKCSSKPTVKNCTFTGNKSTITSNAQVGALAAENSSVDIISCLFEGNEAATTRGGAALYVNVGTATVTDTAFVGNRLSATSAEGGGAIYLRTNTSYVVLNGNTTFEDNDISDIHMYVVTDGLITAAEGIQYTSNEE